ncbi:MAG: hypothetical protein BWK80_41955 [Desulfobacteraceae bacterium IS3]|nr:MAG: hypothetical protein BWK80_41955 [Desulfobacteraceae bacterium IS3]
MKDKITKKKLSEKEIDEIVVSQADDDSAWEEAIETRRTKKSSLAISAELARRAAFLAKLHRENSMEKWLTRIIQERIELEEVAFREAKREMAGISR